MTRLILLTIPLAALVGAAGPSPTAPVSLSFSQGLSPNSGLSIQTQRQAAPPASSKDTVYTAAPTPNADLNAPIPSAESSSQASVGPSLFQPKNQYHGEGYVAGSTVQTEQERRLKFTPGINLRVPLQ